MTLTKYRADYPPCDVCKKNKGDLITNEVRYCIECFEQSDVVKNLTKVIEQNSKHRST